MEQIKAFILNDANQLNFIGKIPVIALIIFLASLGVRLVKRILFKKIDLMGVIEESKVKTIKSLLYNVIKVGVAFVSIISILEILGVNTNSIIATAGVGGVAIGFGAQYIVRDYISGMVIMSEDQYRIGELIIIDGLEGYVEEVGMRLTKLRAFDGSLHIIQNGNILKVTNKSRGAQRVLTEIYIDKNVDSARVLEVLEKSCKRINKEIEGIVEPIEILGLTNMTEFDAVYALKGMVKADEQYAIDRQVRLYALEDLAKAGLGSGAKELKIQGKIEEV